MSRPRLRLLEADAWPAEMRPLAEGSLGALNVMKALMHQPDLFRRWSVLANHFLFKCTLPPNARELLILRAAWLTNCEYEWAQHVKMSAEACGFDAAILKDIQTGHTARRWSSGEQALLHLVDDLIAGPRISGRVWDHLSDNWDERQTLDAIALVGNYVMLAMALNAINVPVDPGYVGFDAATPARPQPKPALQSPDLPIWPARLEPIQARDVAPAIRDLLGKARGPFQTVNIIDTLARHPDLLRRWMPLFNHCLHKQSLDLRQRELVILRTGWLSGSAYEWSQHVPIAQKRGVKPEEIEAIKEGADSGLWRGADKALVETVDALMTRFTLNDAEWRTLASHFTPPRAVDAIFTVGQYRLVAGLLNGINVQLDDYLRFPPPYA